MTTTSSADAAFNPLPLLVAELDLPAAGVQAVLRLLAEGATVPFIARYRKEATGDLDEVQIRAIQERHAYLSEMHERRQTILSSIDEQGKLTDALRAKIEACTTKAQLEDLYLPYKPKRRTRATIAKERGLEPLALRILEQPEAGDPSGEADAFVDSDKEVPDIEAALAGARDIVAEVVSENAQVRALVRKTFHDDGTLTSKVVDDKREQRTKFEQYYDFNESVAQIPSHRFLAVRRGEREGILQLGIDIDEERLLPNIRSTAGVVASSPFAAHFSDACSDAYRRMLAPSVETDVRVDLKMQADRAAVDVFANNMRSILLAAPLGGKPVVGIDPGLRTGCKCVALDATGKFLSTVTIYLTKGEKGVLAAEETFAKFVQEFGPSIVAVGNGTGGRETEAFARRVLKEKSLGAIAVVPVNEAGASIYSASDIAREEFPDIDLTIRGAISIGRRLQDPLAELVKLDPKAIGVGQYQHDVHQPLLGRKLDEVVESCVNHVGVELNTASAPLLSRVAGVGPKLAVKIVAHRESNGAFASRQELLKVPGMGPRTYTQAAGFLRVHGSAHPLDESAVHPERYALVERIAADLGVGVAELVGNKELVDRINVTNYVSAGGDDAAGELTLRDIVAELKKPGRDPRDTFEPPTFRDDVHSLEDLKPGMEFVGVVTNVTAFGAFVDIGVHQDGLVHVSQLADRFVKDPAEVVNAGDKLKVRVMEIDLERKRISLTARSGDRSAQGNEKREADKGRQGRRDGRRGGGDNRGGGGAGQRQQPKFSNNPFANAFKQS